MSNRASSAQRSIIVDYTTGNIPKQLILFAIPFFFSSLLQLMYSLVDSIVVGQFVGSEALSGINTSSQICTFVSMCVQGFSQAAQVIIAQYIGAKCMDGVRKSIGGLFTLTFLFSLVLTIVCEIFLYPILDVLQTPALAYPHAESYLKICAIGFPFVCLYNASCAVMRGGGDSKRPFVIIAVAAGLNLILDLLFVIGFHMGAAGAAWATVIAQFVSMLVSIVLFYRVRNDFDFSFKPSAFLLDRTYCKLLLSQGIPLALKTCAISLTTIFVTGYINTFGVAASAAIAIGNKLTQVPSIFHLSISTAGVSIIGQNLTAGKIDRIKQTIRTILYISIVIYTVCILLLIFFPSAFFLLFTSDEAVLAYAKMCSRCLIIDMVASMLMCPYYTIVFGVGYASFNLFISILDGVVLRLGLALLFGSVFRLGVFGIFLGYCMAPFGTAIPAMIYYYSGRWASRSLVR